MSDINCHEIQENEIEAIRAIYMEDFELIESNVRTWKVSKKFKEFRIRLCPFQEELKGIVEITMWAKLPSSYPKIPPEVSLGSSKGITERQLDELKGIVKRKVNSAVGAEMIFDLADTVLEYITSHHAGTEKSSFYEQMILRQEQKVRADEERALEERERLLLLERERERLEQQTISRALEEDMLRKEKRLEDERRKKKLIKSNLCIGSVLEFDAPIVFPKQDSQAQPVSFQAVFLSYCLQEDPNKIYLATPYESKHLNINTIPPLAVEETIIFPTQDNKLLAIQELREIEESLETLKYIKHPGLLRLLAFKVETVEKDSSWRLFVLSETRLNAPTLKSVLRQNGGTGLAAFKAYFQELLRAVQMLHNNKLAYNCIRTENVFIDSGDDSTDDCTKTIFDQATSIIKLKPKPYVQRSNPTEKKSGIDGSWSPPEFSGEGMVSFKSDIWDIGIVLVEALFGSKVLHNSLSVQELVGNVTLSFPARDILASMLQQSPKERPSVQALLKHTFFKDDRNGPGGSNSGYQTGSSLGISALSQSPNDNQGSLLRRTSDFPTFVSKALSRYNNDFEEIQFLGKGGFGEVVKSRNKLDGRIYAVKKVRLDPRETESSRKILREVAALSRLHHQYIVRYYTAWLEDASGAWDDEDGFSSDSSFEEESTDYSQIHEADSDFLFTETSASRRRHDSFGISFQKESKGYSEESSGVDSAQRMLYIQMEYCDRSTLRDVVDEGVSVEDAWNIFRQMLAGLDHLHSQGMIHRDLKPSNIFLASNGDVKIGDFGLATSSHNGAEVYAPGKQSIDFVQGSLTSEIGTSLYISPEVLTKARYSQKVDMYSLGIIFFEMLYPFSTGMERIVALRDLRLPEIRFPLNFRHDKLTAQAQIIRSLLSHDEKERPTAMELLRSQLLPSRMEDEFILECIRTVSNPSAPHYRHLIDTLFRTEPDRRSDLVYGRKALLGLDSVTGYYDVIRAILTKVFRRHGAVELSAPTLAPKAGSFSNLQKPYHALDQQGRVVQLPYDLTLPFSRMIARTGMLIKRFVFGKVFRQNSEEAEGAPLEVMEADFDIVTSTADLASEAEVLKVLDEAMSAFPPGLTADYCFQINHGRIATLILDTCKVPAAHRATVAIILSQLGLSKTLAQVRALLGRGQLPRATVEELLVFYVVGDLESSHGRLRKLLKLHKQQVDLIFADLFTLQSYLRRLGVHRKVLFNSFLMYNLHYYEGGLLFRAARDGKRGDILAVGGRYDALLTSQRIPLSGTRETPHAVGASIALQKLILMLERFETQRPTSRKPEDDRALAIWTPRQLDVLIASFGPGLLEDRMDIAKELWSHHIRCDFVREPGELPTNTLGAQWVVFIKSSRREGIKVRNLLAKSECEVALSDLPNYLLYEIAEQARLDLQVAHRRRGDALHKMSEEDVSLSRSEHPFAPPNPLFPEETSFGPFGVNVLSVGVDRINSKRKRMLMDRALAAVLRIAHNSFKSNTQVYIMEVPREDLRKFQDCYLYDEEGFKKVVAALPLYQRSQLQAARTALLALGHDPPTAWLYSVKDDCALNYQLIQHR